MDDGKNGIVREAQDRFVDTWGQMGSAWGISRTMAEVHALLYIAGDPLCMDDVMERLQISRGSASMSLRALVDWDLIAKTHKRGDRKEYFRAEQDVWAMFRAILRQRLKREVDPLLASLYEIRDMTRDDDDLDHRERLDAMLEFCQTVERLSRAFVSPDGQGLQAAADLLDGVEDE